MVLQARLKRHIDQLQGTPSERTCALASALLCVHEYALAGTVGATADDALALGLQSEAGGKLSAALEQYEEALLTASPGLSKGIASLHVSRLLCPGQRTRPRAIELAGIAGEHFARAGYQLGAGYSDVALAAALFESGEFDRAEAVVSRRLREQIATEPTLEAVLFLQGGQFSAARSDFDAARRSYEKAASIASASSCISLAAFATALLATWTEAMSPESARISYASAIKTLNATGSVVLEMTVRELLATQAQDTDCLHKLMQSFKDIGAFGLAAETGVVLAKHSDPEKQPSILNAAMDLADRSGADPVRTTAAIALAEFHEAQGDLATAVGHYRLAEQLCKEFERLPARRAYCLQRLGFCAAATADHAGALALFDESAALFGLTGDSAYCAWSRFHAAESAHALARPDAVERFEAAEDGFRRVGSSPGLGQVSVRLGWANRSVSRFLTALRSARSCDDTKTELSALNGLADIAARKGRSKRAIVLLQRALALARPESLAEERGLTLVLLAEIDDISGERARAIARLLEAERLFIAAGATESARRARARATEIVVDEE